MSLAMSAAPLAVRRPATAQLLLPAGGRGPAWAAAPPVLPRTSSTSAAGAGSPAAACAASGGESGASQLVPAGYRKASAHFQAAAHSAPPRRPLLSRRR